MQENELSIEYFFCRLFDKKQNLDQKTTPTNIANRFEEALGR